MNHVRKMVTDNITWLQMVSEGYDKAQKNAKYWRFLSIESFSKIHFDVFNIVPKISSNSTRFLSSYIRPLLPNILDAVTFSLFSDNTSDHNQKHACFFP